MCHVIVDRSGAFIRTGVVLWIIRDIIYLLVLLPSLQLEASWIGVESLFLDKYLVFYPSVILFRHCPECCYNRGALDGTHLHN